MRVIAGSHKGRKLKSVPGKQTRPTSDKVKETVFHTIGPFFTGGKCLDLFAGSGSLGIEALSRGMEQAIFIDQYPKAVQTIKRNLQLLNIDRKSNTSELQSRGHLVCRLLLEKKKQNKQA